jgi:hypothetical protein
MVALKLVARREVPYNFNSLVALPRLRDRQLSRKPSAELSCPQECTAYRDREPSTVPTASVLNELPPNFATGWRTPRASRKYTPREGLCP